MEPLVILFALVVGVVRALSTRRNHRATRTVARALGNASGTRREARFAREPRGRFFR